MQNAILEAKINRIINYAIKQYSKNRGLHLNSKDWAAFINVGTPQYYSFLINGTIKFYTTSKISGERYDQLIKLVDYKKLEAPLLLLYLVGTPEKLIAKFIAMYLSLGEAKLFCNDPSFQFWGPHYNLTQIKSAYGPGETRPPDIRDPERKNLVCKHLWQVLVNYKSLVKNLAIGLLPYYKRLFGLTSPTGIDRLKKNLGLNGFKRIIEQTIRDLNNLHDKRIVNTFNRLTEGKLNELTKPYDQANTKLSITPVKKFETIDKAKPENEKTETEKMQLEKKQQRQDKKLKKYIKPNQTNSTKVSPEKTNKLEPQNNAKKVKPIGKIEPKPSDLDKILDEEDGELL